MNEPSKQPSFLTYPDVRGRPAKLWQLARERAHSRVMLLRHYPGEVDEPVDFTCDACPHVAQCRLAFDHYNLDGDCLAEK